MLTISQFSDRTGISPSALRFYDRKGLLPARRLANGYRVYRREQIARARLLTSLREAGVSLAAIRRFLARDRNDRAELLQGWQREAATRLMMIQLAWQYLDGLRSGEPHVHLCRWDKRSSLLWHPAEADAGPLPFRDVAAKLRRRLTERGVRVTGGAFVRTLGLHRGVVTGEVGFRVPFRAERHALAGWRQETVGPAVFATLECHIDDDKAAHRVFRYLAELRAKPTGMHLERYLAGEAERYELMIAVLESG